MNMVAALASRCDLRKRAFANHDLMTWLKPPTGTKPFLALIVQKLTLTGVELGWLKIWRFSSNNWDRGASAWQVLQNCEKIELAVTLKNDRASSHRPRKKLYLRNWS